MSSTEDSDQSLDDVGPSRARRAPARTYRKASHGKRRLLEVQASDSYGQVPPPRKRTRRTVSRITYSRVEDPDSDVEAVSVTSTECDRFPEDETVEREAAIAMSGIISPRTARRRNQASVVIIPEPTVAPRTLNLLHGVHEYNLWHRFFLPTFLKTMAALQMVWDRVYGGEETIGGTRMVGRQVYLPATQRVSEWRSSFESTALVLVNDYFGSNKLYTTEERQQAAADFLFSARYTLTKLVMSLKTALRRGSYRGSLLIYTFAQHLIDTETAINVPGLMEEDDFPRAALALSAVAVHHALELWEKGYLIYEPYIVSKKKKNVTTGGIVKVVGRDHTLRRTMNFGREQCEQGSVMHCSSVWRMDDARMRVIMADAKKAADIIRRNSFLKPESSSEDEAESCRRTV